MPNPPAKARKPRAKRAAVAAPIAREGIPADLLELAVPTAGLQHYERNARVHDLPTLAASLEQHGQYRPIVVNRGTLTGRPDEVLAGNGTLIAARELGWDHIAATYVDVDEDTAARIVLVDNRASDIAGYDGQALVDLLTSLDGLDGTGYTTDALTQLLQELGIAALGDGATDPDEIPPIPLPEDAEAATGDIWTLGDHRLICGDATDPATIATLMAGRAADLLLTDPPYGVSYVGKTADALTIQSDELRDDDLYRLLADAFTAAATVLQAGTPAYTFLADENRLAFDQAMRAAGITPRQTLIWVKQHFVLGRQDYQWRHEPILYGWVDGAAHRWYGGFDKDTVAELEQLGDPRKMSKAQLADLVARLLEAPATVIHADRPSRSEHHPTTKPTKILEQLIANSARYGDAVLDPFGGSGSTLIAAERAGRHAYLAEIDPAYCDVIVRRWERYTERAAILQTA